MDNLSLRVGFSSEPSLPSERLNNARKHEAVALLVTECERRGLLNEVAEQRLRTLANEACITHGMNSIAERDGPLIQVGDHLPEVFRQGSQKDSSRLTAINSY